MGTHQLAEAGFLRSGSGLFVEVEARIVPDRKEGRVVAIFERETGVYSFERFGWEMKTGNQTQKQKVFDEVELNQCG